LLLLLGAGRVGCGGQRLLVSVSQSVSQSVRRSVRARCSYRRRKKEKQWERYGTAASLGLQLCRAWKPGGRGPSGQAWAAQQESPSDKAGNASVPSQSTSQHTYLTGLYILALEQVDFTPPVSLPSVA